MKKKLLIVGIMLLIGILIVSCGGNDAPTASENHPPTQPTLDGPSGAPTNGATGVSLTPVLRWLATDPDDDALTYTVKFGATSPAPTVNEVTGTSYSPTGLSYSTKYYWSIIAKDPDGATASSDEWYFTTMAEPVESISTPSTISGPATGIIDQGLNFDASGSTSSLGHTLEYRFEWGDENYSSWSTTAGSHFWDAAGTYEIIAQARCIEHPAVTSNWSDPMTIIITAFAVETVSTPGTPVSNSSSAEEGESINFSCAASTSSKSHQVQYRWDFGDGSALSLWSSVRSRSYTWTAAGTYQVKAQARCSTDPLIMSEWSGTKTVTITVPGAETVSIPDVPTFTDSTLVGVAVIFTVTGSNSSDGHPVQYQVDFGDSTATWFAYNATIYHVYDEAGTYIVKAMARCNTHNDINSGWSEEATIVIVNPPEALTYNTKLIYGDVVNGSINESYEYGVAHSETTNLGDPMEGQYDWGDGTTSAWVQNAERNQTHAWTTEGTYGITYTGRCTVHNDFTFQTDTLWVTIVTEATETVSTPSYVNWRDTQDHPMLDTEIIYYAYGGTSSLGHDTESRISWGDGDTTGWVAANTQILKTWTELGTFSMTRQSRCIEHPDVISEWSETSYIITGPELVSPPDAPPGPAAATKGSAVYFLGTGAESSWHSYSWLSYRFAWGDGDTTEWKIRLDTLVGHNYSTVGEFEVKAQAKCIWTGHTNPVSEWSLSSVINILESITFNENVTGPSDGPINKSLTFEQSSTATSSEGHDMEYRFAFGDGDTSLWAAELTASHSYTAAGRYSVKAQARCATHAEAMTEWSTTYYTWHYIDITDGPETVSMPAVSISLNTTIGDSTAMRVSRSISNYGDSLEYQIDYGDGNLSAWLPSTYNKYQDYWDIVPEWNYYTYAAVGSYGVRGRARCVVHPTVITDWSTVTSMQTAVILESVSMPAAPTGPSTGTVGTNMTFTTTGAASSEGHQLEYQWSYRGPANDYTDWTTSLSDTKVFSTAGEYYVYILARCVEHPDAQNGWSEKFYFTITE